MNRARLDNWCEQGILGLVLAMLIWAPLATGAVRVPDFLVLQWLAVGVAALWLPRFWLNPQPRLLWPPVCWAAAAFVLYAVGRYRQADIEYVARAELIRVLVYAVVFFAVVNNLNRPAHTQIIAATLIFLAMAISIYAVFQFITKSDRVWTFIRPAQYAGRGSGTYICPNHLAGFLETVLPLGLAFTLAGRLGPAARIGAGYATLTILAGIGVTVSRGGWIATALALVVFFAVLIQKRAFRLPAVLFLGLLLGGAIWFVATAQFTQERFTRTFGGGKLEDIRFQLWQPAIDLWRENFWWGAGPGHFDHTFRPYRPPEMQLRPDRVHNDYLNTLADWGLAGALLVGAAWLLIFDGVKRIWKHVERAGSDLGAKPGNRAAFVLGASVGLFALLLHSAVDFNFHIPANALVAITLMALLTAHWRHATERFWWRAGWIGRITGTAVCLSALTYLGAQALQRREELARLNAADQLQNQPGPCLTQLRAAYAADPMNFETAFRLGEAYRMQSWEGNDDYRKPGEEAITWFRTVIRLNPHDPFAHVRLGMTLDWLERHSEAAVIFRRALELDPNGYWTVAHQGWHAVQMGDYRAAEWWFQRSLQLNWWNNSLAESYREIARQRLKEGVKTN